MLFFPVMSLAFATNSLMRRYRANLDLSLFARTCTTRSKILRQAKNPVIPENVWDPFVFCYAYNQIVEENRILKERLKSIGMPEINQENLNATRNFDAGQNSINFHDDDNFDVNLMNKILQEQNPLYPIVAEDLKKIFRVYAALPNLSARVISNVLRGHTDTGKSKPFRDIKEYLEQHNSTLGEYRKIYAKISKSLRETPIGILQKVSSARFKSGS